jgi:catechol 2,3-dioxygenase
MAAITKEHESIDARTSMGPVALKVKDLDRSLRFYQGALGFSLIDRTGSNVRVGTSDGKVLLELHGDPSATARPPRTTGLYHVAILLPTRADLGRMLARLIESGIRIGHSDHLVSEALYLSDPDGNGLEIYRDRPRDEWRWRDGQVSMAIDPLDLQGIFDEGKRGEWTGLPAGTVVGHVHLNVGDLKKAEEFYHGILGFDIVASLPGALFVSAGGYHHHLGLNVWESNGGGTAPKDSIGLHRFTIVVPDTDALAGVRDRLERAGIGFETTADGIETLDPWRNRMWIEVGSQTS